MCSTCDVFKAEISVMEANIASCKGVKTKKSLVKALKEKDNEKASCE